MKSQQQLNLVDDRTPSRRVRHGVPTNDLVFSAYTEGNEKVFPRIMDLYVPANSVVADVTYGKGVFWRNIPDGR
ncbi:MAG: hypothetical protein F4Y75_00285 [Acidimicrobiia bacterium]|nr:hypothetical protein [bacterium]MXZ05949.1 hypothetical protein [Acidimicrobiia bacterium]MCY3653200.1 hypothetical protein [bacterium]MDE0642640.1 hypothetical protein [bacterium]MYD05030.1 hypothetical protein [Acidimicrobiia bacterium]